MSDTQVIPVTIIKIDIDVDLVKRDGGTYKGSALAYENTKGDIYKKSIAEAALKFTPELKGKLAKLTPGEKVNLVMQKKGEFTNLVDVVREGEALPAVDRPTNTATNTTSTVTRSTGTNTSSAVGMQVGNAISNATLLLAHKVANGTLLEVATMVIQTGELLKAKLESGELTPKKEVTKVKEQIEDENVPF